MLIFGSLAVFLSSCCVKSIEVPGIYDVTQTLKPITEIPPILYGEEAKVFKFEYCPDSALVTRVQGKTKELLNKAHTTQLFVDYKMLNHYIAMCRVHFMNISGLGETLANPDEHPGNSVNLQDIEDSWAMLKYALDKYDKSYEGKRTRELEYEKNR